MSAFLSFEQAPPIAVPLRFFITAPLFLILAGALLMWEGEAALVTRWAGSTLALVHLFTLGFLLQVMLGALFQLLPVAVGAAAESAERIAGFVHPPLACGALLVVGGFLWGGAALFMVGGALIAGALLLYMLTLGRSLWSTATASASAAAIKMGLAALAATVVLGLYLLHLRAGGRPPVVSSGLTDIHAIWGLLGWGGLLTAGVAYIVVPMFQLTPAYQPVLMRWLAPSLAGLLIVWTLSRIGQFAWAQTAIGLLLVGLASVYALATLVLQGRSKRPRVDTTFLFWQFGMLSLLVAAPLLVMQNFVGIVDQRLTLGVGVLVIFGYFTSLINGMLYKIVPFLAWLHVQRRHASGELPGRAPHMGKFLAERRTRMQFAVHCAALACLILALVWPGSLARLAGGLVALSGVLLQWNLVSVVLSYRLALRAGRATG